MTRTGVVVVTYNSAEVIERCLDSCGDLPVVVVDNASTDGTCELVRRRDSVTLIANAANCWIRRRGESGRGRARDRIDSASESGRRIDIAGGRTGGGLQRGWNRIGGGEAGERARAKSKAGFTLRRFPTPGTLVFEVLGINRVLPANPVNRRYRCLDLDLDRGRRGRTTAGSFPDVPARSVAAAGRF